MIHHILALSVGVIWSCVVMCKTIMDFNTVLQMT